MMMLSASATTSRLGLAAPRKARTQLLAPRTVVARVAAKPFKSPIPAPQEEASSAHEAFMHALESAKPVSLRMPGLQQFAAAIWERRRRIPSSTYSDPLDHIFTEFDADNDGHLTAPEVASALQSRGVEADVKQLQEFINAIDTNANGTVERNEFADFIFHLAVAELKTAAAASSTQSETDE